jgi:hypothetical protein
LEDKRLKRLDDDTGKPPITLNESKLDTSGIFPLFCLLKNKECAIARTTISPSVKNLEIKGATSNASSMWFPTNRTGPSEGIPAKPFTIFPSSKVENITELVILSIKLEVL